jgi:hypothetical protein
MDALIVHGKIVRTRRGGLLNRGKAGLAPQERHASRDAIRGCHELVKAVSTFAERVEGKMRKLKFDKK